MPEVPLASFPLWKCPECSYHGIQNVPGGVGPWPGDGKVRCPSRTCEFATVMERVGTLVAVDALLSDQAVAGTSDPRDDLMMLSRRSVIGEAIAVVVADEREPEANA